jgi:hypothetical protein
MSKKLSERQRWVKLRQFQFYEGNSVAYAAHEFDQLHAVVHAFEQVGRVVRLETNGSALVLKARR